MAAQLLEFITLHITTFRILSAAQQGAWDRLPIFVSAVVGLIGVYLAVMARADNKKKDEAKKTLDTLTLGQEWVVGALDRATEENKRLRDDFVQQQHDHEEEIRGWMEKVEHQEDEIIALKNDNARITKSCEKMEKELESFKERYEALEAHLEALKKKLETQ